MSCILSESECCILSEFESCISSESCLSVLYLKRVESCRRLHPTQTPPSTVPASAPSGGFKLPLKEEGSSSGTPDVTVSTTSTESAAKAPVAAAALTHAERLAARRISSAGGGRGGGAGSGAGGRSSGGGGAVTKSPESADDGVTIRWSSPKSFDKTAGGGDTGSRGDGNKGNRGSGGGADGADDDDNGSGSGGGDGGGGRSDLLSPPGKKNSSESFASTRFDVGAASAGVDLSLSDVDFSSDDENLNELGESAEGVRRVTLDASPLRRAAAEAASEMLRTRQPTDASLHYHFDRASVSRSSL